MRCIINPTTKKRMDELTVRKTATEVRIAREEIQEQILTKEQIEFRLSKMVSQQIDPHKWLNKSKCEGLFCNC